MSKTQLYVVPVSSDGGGTDFILVCALSTSCAREMVLTHLALNDWQVGEVEEAVTAIAYQYDGMAILGAI